MDLDADANPSASAAARLAALRDAYLAAPDRADALLDALIALPAAPDEPLHRIERARLAGQLALERRNPRAAEPLLLDCQPAAAHAAELDAYLARADIQQLRFDAARERLRPALQADDALVRALAQAAAAQLAHREGELQRALELAEAARQGFLSLRWPGPWVQVYATLSLVLRELGQRERRQACMAEGIALCVAQRRWSEAANLASGRFDMALDDRDLAAAATALAEVEALAANDPSGADAPGKAMARFSRARLLAAQGRHAEACADLGDALRAQRHRLVAYEYAQRLDQLADWLLLAGQPEQALRTAAEAQQVEREHQQRLLQRDLALQRQALQVEQAEQERAVSEQHALRMEAQRAALAQTLERQRELHQELIEARKLAGLGELLIALSRALEPPLRQAGERVDDAQRGGRAVLAGIAAGEPLSRRALQQALQQGMDACAQAQSLVERAIAELGVYRALRDEA